jgi:hypothetical protein
VDDLMMLAIASLFLGATLGLLKLVEILMVEEKAK